ncbi:DUF4123 domain-containing protein [Pseudomonas sp. JZ134]|uniref:DUF4123 domain-containing protein n=1 Tax=Pseudomonas sp. JZ134 TaxID=2806615 RepID=UPI003DA103E3
MSPVYSWIQTQTNKQRSLYLIIDSLAEPNPIPELFGSGGIKEYANLYQGTSYEELSAIAPWLIRIEDMSNVAIQRLIQHPERDWGWLACAEFHEFSAIKKHLQDRIEIHEDEQISLYRFQDPRVIARSLAYLKREQAPYLLGPFESVLYWHSEKWKEYNNPNPSFSQLPEPPFPWLYSEPDETKQEIKILNLEQWLWENQPAETTELAKQLHIRTWLKDCLAKAEIYQWKDAYQLFFLLMHNRLNQLNHPAWEPLPDELPLAHFNRCQSFFRP